MTQSTDRIERKILLQGAAGARVAGVVQRRRVRQLVRREPAGPVFRSRPAHAGARSRIRATSTSSSRSGSSAWSPSGSCRGAGIPQRSEKGVDYSSEPTTLVTFELQDADGGTLLSVVESGFDNVPPHRRLGAFRMNSEGWDEQMKNIEKHVAAR